MKVLVVHNRYVSRNPSGENDVVDYELGALPRIGVEVIPYLRHSDEIPELPLLERTALPVRPVLSPWDIRAIRRLLRDERPDVVHLHNPYPLISPAIIRVARGVGVPVVQTVHNHRHVCPSATFFRDGQECHDCLGRAVALPAVRHGCYRGSRGQSAVMASALALHRGTFRLVDRYIALAPHLVNTLLSIGIDPHRIVVKPNTIEDPGAPPAAPRRGVVFVGRLSDEKGPRLLLEAWLRAFPDRGEHSLTFIGDGPERGDIERAAATRDDIFLRGQVPAANVRSHMRQAALVVVPSRCSETFPRVVLEAFANGCPVLATAVGGLPDLVDDDVGWVAAPTADAIAASLQQALASRLEDRGGSARVRYVERYHPDRVLEQLLAVYADVARIGGAGHST